MQKHTFQKWTLNSLCSTCTSAPLSIWILESWIKNLESRINCLECGTQSKSLGIRMYNSPPHFRVVSKIFVLHKVSARWCLYTVCICHTSEVGNTGKDGHWFHFVCLITASAIFSSVMLEIHGRVDNWHIHWRLRKLNVEWHRIWIILWVGCSCRGWSS